MKKNVIEQMSKVKPFKKKLLIAIEDFAKEANKNEKLIDDSYAIDYVSDVVDFDDKTKVVENNICNAIGDCLAIDFTSYLFNQIFQFSEEGMKQIQKCFTGIDEDLLDPEFDNGPIDFYNEIFCDETGYFDEVILGSIVFKELSKAGNDKIKEIYNTIWENYV